MKIDPIYIQKDNYVCDSFFRDCLGIDLTHYHADEVTVDNAIQSYLPHLLDVPARKFTAGALAWLEENCSGPWFLNYSRQPSMISVFFFNNEDAVAFRLITS